MGVSPMCTTGVSPVAGEEEEEEEETDTAKMAVVHTGRMPVPQPSRPPGGAGEFLTCKAQWNDS